MPQYKNNSEWYNLGAKMADGLKAFIKDFPILNKNAIHKTLEINLNAKGHPDAYSEERVDIKCVSQFFHSHRRKHFS